MKSILEIAKLEEMILEIRGERVLLDCDVANIYGVATKRVNEAVKNNPTKFPQGYSFKLSENEFVDVRSKISTAKFVKTRVTPTVFTEKGLYMLATILKSPVATEASLLIIETFSRLRELSRNIQKLSKTQDKRQQKCLTQRSGELFTEIFDDDLELSDSETTVELNFAVLKFKRTVKKQRGQS